MCNKYHAQINNVPICLSSLRNEVTDLSNSNIVFNGIKTFNNTPIISNTVNTGNPNNIPNIKCVKDMIGDYSGFIAEGQYIDYDPGNGRHDYTNYDGYEDNPKQMYWHIDHNHYDSSEWIDEYGTKAGSVICKYTGNLVCYGWLADNGNVRPENAWVGLFGHVKCGNSDDLTWAAL
jgi:hypothetical protein